MISTPFRLKMGKKNSHLIILMTIVNGETYQANVMSDPTTGGKTE